jgi:hypothetical protein
LTLAGDYWTERKTRGRLTTSGRSKRLYDDYESAAEGGETREQKLLRERAEALDDLAAAARELGVPPGEWPGVEEYQRVAKQLGLRYSSQQIIRRWDYWDDAGAALVGKRISETPKQRAIRRVSSGRRRTHEEYLAGLRDWLAPTPASRTEDDYDAWANAENARRGPALLPYVGASAVQQGLALSWRWALAVASHELELPEAQQRYLDELIEAAGPLALVGTVGVALILGVGLSYAQELTRRPGFPAPAAQLGRVRAWYRTDVESHHAGKPAPKRSAGELNDRLMASAEVREPLGLRADAFIAAIHRRHFHRVPPPAGSVSQTHYWLRENVEQWMAEHPERLAENRRRRQGSRANRPAKSPPTGAERTKKSR